MSDNTDDAKIKKYNFSDSTRDNLHKLADHLEEFVTQDQFDMSMLSNGHTYSTDVDTICGTVACVLGHAPRLFGIEDKDFDPDGEFNHDRFTKRVFPELSPNKNGTMLWCWCFSASWKRYDNTVMGAVKRIRYMLEQSGLPRDWSPTESYPDHFLEWNS